MGRSILKIILGRTIGFLIFLLLIAVANFSTRYVDIHLYIEIVGFFNDNLILFLTMMIVGLVNETFWHFYFPFNILAPITSASLGSLITNFVYRFWLFINGYVNLDVSIPIYLIYVCIFWIILIAGYLTILVRKGRPKYTSKDLKVNEKGEFENKKRIEWEDVDNQFKLVLYNIGRGINSKFGSRNTKVSKKKRR